MKIKATHLLTFVFLAALIVSVSATGYSSDITIGKGQPSISFTPSGAGAGAGGAITGSFSLTYPDGRPVTLGSNTVTIQACGPCGCISFQVTLTPGSTPGQYVFTFIAGSNFPTGAVTLTIPAGSMTDSSGNSFPAVDTVIGTIMIGSSAPTASCDQGAASPTKASAAKKLVRVAQPTTPASQRSPNYTIITTIAILSMLGLALVFFPARH